MEDMVIVDNAVYSFSYQLDNGIPIIPFRDDPEDDQLEKLVDFMKILAGQGDVRNKIREHFRMTELYDSDFQAFMHFYVDPISEQSNEETLDLLDNCFAEYQSKLKLQLYKRRSLY